MDDDIKKVLMERSVANSDCTELARLRFSGKSHEDGGGHSARAVGNVKVL
jgi:hypothetical protein